MADPTYAFWLKPAGPVYDLLAQTIRDLADELGGPVFEPHVTLIAYLEGSEADHLRLGRDVAARLRPYRLTLTEPAWLDEHFRSLFMLVEQTPAVMRAHAEIARACCRGDETYMPHLSLAYGMFPEDVKRKAAARLPAGVRATFDVTSLVLLRSDSMDPKDWYEVGDIPLPA